MNLAIRAAAFFALSFLAPSLRAERIYLVYDHSMMWMDFETGPGGSGMGGGVDYDIALSPDGRILYHLSGEQLVVRDPLSLSEMGQGIRVPQRLRWIRPSRSGMAVARNGSLLYFLKLYSSATEEDAAVATFDTVTKQLLKQEAHLSECQGATPIPLHEDRKLLVVCGGDSTVHFLTIGADGSAADDFILTIPPKPVKPIPGPRVGRSDAVENFVQSVLTADGSELLLVKLDGRITKVDVASRFVTAAASVSPVANTRIMPSVPCLSPDGTLLYLTAKSRTNFGDTNEQILVLDTSTLALHATITPPAPFGAMALSGDGERLYTSERKSGVLHAISTATGQEIRALGNSRISTSQDGPNFLVVAP